MKPSVGRIVHYVGGEYQYKELPHIAAIITAVDPYTDEVCLWYFDQFTIGVAPNIQYSETPEPYTWHWPEKVE